MESDDPWTVDAFIDEVLVFDALDLSEDQDALMPMFGAAALDSVGAAIIDAIINEKVSE